MDAMLESYEAADFTPWPVANPRPGLKGRQPPSIRAERRMGSKASKSHREQSVGAVSPLSSTLVES